MSEGESGKVGDLDVVAVGADAVEVRGEAPHRTAPKRHRRS